ncbi:MAG: rhomboid family intramembrane serine protease [Acidiferrobacterales bacterium]
MIPLHDNNPTDIFPFVTVALIVASVLVFFWQLSLGPEGQKVVYALGVIPASLLQNKSLPPELYRVPAELTLLTSMFLHGGWMHLIGNMLFLWIFGNNVEDAMGHGRFIVFYIVSGLAAALAQALPDPASVTPMIGASGAISGVLGAYLLLHPRARVLVAIPIGFFVYATKLPAMLVLGFWFVLQLINSLLAGAGGGGVAWRAHVGGFVAGIVLIPIFKYRRVRLFH